MPALIQPAVCPPSPVPLRSGLIMRMGMSAIIPPRVCTPDAQHVSTIYGHGRGYAYMCADTFDSVTFLLPGGGHANVGGSI